MTIHPAHLPHCIYCGSRASELDHVLPWSQRNTKGLHHLRFLAACCSRCNKLAGGILFTSVASKMRYLSNIAKTEGRLKCEQLRNSAHHVKNYLYLLENGKFTAQLDAEYALISERSVPFYDMTKPRTTSKKHPPKRPKPLPPPKAKRGWIREPRRKYASSHT